MVRPGDWSLLGGSDPCPGSIDDVQAAARTWQDNYNILNEVRSGLASSGITGTGQAVTAIRTLLNRNAALAGAIADRAQTNADVFFTWGGQLTQFQADADRLLTQAIQADEDRQQALALMAASGGGIPTPTLQSPFTQNTQNAPASPFPASTDAGLAGLLEDQAREADRQRGQALLNQAQQHLDDLSRQADELHQAHQDAGNTCAKNLQPLDLAAVTHDSGIDPTIPVGAGALTALLNPGKDPDLKKFDTLHSKINTGNNSARNDYLEQLAKLTPEQLVLYKLWKPEQTRNPLPALPGEDVPSAKKWWQNLNKTIQLALMGAVPGIIGNLNGIPYTTRSKANDALMKELKDDPTTNKNTLTALNVIEDKLVLDNGKRNPDRSIISFDPNNGKPLAALAIGNLDTAGNVTWNVPGMNTTVSDGMESWADSAQDLYKNQTEEFKRLHKDGKNAVVAWIGYDTPPAPPASWGVLFTDAAVKGADKLQVALDGFQDTRGPGNGYTINVAAHSYGTTTSSIALTHTKYPVDTVAFFGSAGIDPDRVPNAAAMHVNHGTDGQPAVYETHSSSDLIAPTGIALSQGALPAELLFSSPINNSVLGNPADLVPREDPTWDRFGGHNFSSEGGYDQNHKIYNHVDGHDANGRGDHRSILYASSGDGYLNIDTESNHNISLITTEQGEKIQALAPLDKNPDGSYDDTKFHDKTHPNGWQPSDWDSGPLGEPNPSTAPPDNGGYRGR